MDLKELYHWEIDQEQLRQIDEWRKLPTLYQIALDELQNKLKLIQSEWKIHNGYSPIEHIKTRIKEPKSILAKGVVLTHDNVLITAANGIKFDNLTQDEEVLAYLPMASRRTLKPEVGRKSSPASLNK